MNGKESDQNLLNKKLHETREAIEKEPSKLINSDLMSELEEMDYPERIFKPQKAQQFSN